MLKVYSATDGSTAYRAYVILWKGQEVVVEDSLLNTNHEVGDTVTVLVMKHRHPNINATTDLLKFMVTSHSKRKVRQ